MMNPGILLVGLCFMAGTLSAAEVVSSPVGFLKVTFPTNVTTSLSIPLQKNPSFVGPVTACSASTLTDSNASWTGGQFSGSSSSFLVKMVTGTAAGRYYLITANTTTTLTLDTRGADLSSVVSVGNRYQIVAAPTLGTLFGTSTVPFITHPSKSLADYIQVWTGSNWQSYWHTGVQWITSGTSASQNHTILYPDESLLVFRRGATPLTIAIAGEISMITEQTEMGGPGNTFAANRYPVNVTLNSLGLLALPNWIKDPSGSVADRVQIRENGSWVTYWHTGVQWRKSGSTLSQDNAPIPAGRGYYVLRRSSSVSVNSFATQAKPY